MTPRRHLAAGDGHLPDRPARRRGGAGAGARGIRFEIAVLICGVFMTVYIVFGGMLATTWIQISRPGC